MKTLVTTVSERGQVSIPAEVRRALHLEPGMKLTWQPVSDHVCQVEAQQPAQQLGAMAMRGYAKQFRRPRRTSDWMAELRDGEEA